MCIILFKQSGIKLPSKTVLENCFKRNSDGAGIMYQADDKAIAHKGYMDFKSFHEAYTSFNFTVDDTFALHFRIGTSGSKTESLCHPYPISQSLKSLKMLSFKSDSAIMHNGILGHGDKKLDLNDTQVFVRDVLSIIHHHIDRQSVLETLSELTSGSKMLIFKRGQWYMTGKWEDDEGILYSNSAYKNRQVSIEWHDDYSWSGNTFKRTKSNTVEEYWEGYGDGYEQCLADYDIDDSVGVIHPLSECPSCEGTVSNMGPNFWVCEDCFLYLDDDGNSF